MESRRALVAAAVRYIELRHADPFVGHAIINVDTIRSAEVAAPIDAGAKHHVGEFEQQTTRLHRRTTSPTATVGLSPFFEED